jgi:DNA-binding GntR family transcriptional regulator
VHKRSRDAVRDNDRDSYRKINFEFHDTIYRGAHNAYLTATTVSMRQRIAAFRRAQFTIPGRLAKSFQEHDAIVTAVLRADAETASDLMRAHVNVVRVATSDYVHELERAAAQADATADGQAEGVGG